MAVSRQRAHSVATLQGQAGGPGTTSMGRGGSGEEETQGGLGLGEKGWAETGKSTRHCLPLYTHVTLV